MKLLQDVTFGIYLQENKGIVDNISAFFIVNGERRLDTWV